MPTRFSSLLRGPGLPWLLLSLVLAVALLLRTGAVARSVVDEPVRGDARSYLFYAVNLIEDGVYSRSLPPVFGGAPVTADADAHPGYPLFVRALLTNDWRAATVDGVSRSIARVIDLQTLLSCLAVLAVFLIGRRLAGNGVGLAAAALTALSPHLVNINIYLLTEPLFITVFWVSMALLARAMAQPDARALTMAAGLGLGLATLVRPTTQYLPLLLAGLFLLPPRRDWRQSLLLLAGFLIPMLAWTARNLVSTGSPSGSLGLVATIQVGIYPDFMYNGIPASLGIPYRFDPDLTDYGSLQRTLSVLAERFRGAPGEYLHWYLIGKPLALFHWETIPIGTSTGQLMVAGDIYQYPTPVTPYAGHPAFVASYILSKLLHAPLLVLAASGAVLAWVPALRGVWGAGLPLMRLLGVTLAYVVALHMVGSPFPRYSVPFLPLAYLLALATLAGLWRYWRSRPPTAPLPAGD